MKIEYVDMFSLLKLIDKCYPHAGKLILNEHYQLIGCALDDIEYLLSKGE
jgi:hypothetical protein